MRSGDTEAGVELFRRAIEADPQFAPAYVNRAKTFFAKSDFVSAAEVLSKAVAINPKSLEALILLATAQLQNREFEQALQNARKIHTMPHKDFGGSHLVAGNALEALKRPSEALEEYKLYVAETPNGANVARARARIEQMSNQPH
jgi:tetratricopeptide (TPR) repeat protein